MKSSVKKLMALVLTLTILSSFFCTYASAATWRTGCVPKSGNSGYTTVRLNSTSKDAKIKIHSYSYLVNQNNGKEKSTSFHITMRTTSGQWLWEGDITTGSSGKTMTLGKNHSAYRIYIRQNNIPFGSWTLNYADYYGIECKSNCYC